MKINLLGLRLLQASCLTFSAFTVNAQISFTNSNSVLHSSTGVLGSNGNVRSGCAVTVVDMNNDGLDDICKLSDAGAVTIDYQQPGGSFVYQNTGSMGASAAWSMSAGDVDRNGYKDVLVGYGSSLKLMKVGASGSMSVTTLPSSNFFVQNMNFTDVNNDGWIDIFACDDNSFAKLYINNGSGSFPAEAGNSVINFDITPGQTTGTSNDDSGNYGSVWTDFDNDGDVDLYIAHCRQAVTSPLNDPRRVDKLFVNNGSGVFTENAAAYGLASQDQDWTASFADINNDGDQDLFLAKHDVISEVYTNNGANQFTVSSSINFGSMPMQSLLEDLDNDGFVDLIMTGDNDNRIYHNNGNSTFTDVTPTYLKVSSNNLLSFAAGDLNHDGKVDIYGSYGTTYNNPGNVDDVFWKNTTNNTNHFLTLVMVASVSNRDALGAKAKIYGAWGVQTREVRAGESYGTISSAQLHFGLGAASAVDSIVVTWPSGIRTVVHNPTIDQFLNVSEQNPCLLSSASITPSGPTNLCTSGSVTLTATGGTGYTYLWSNNATTQAITVTTAGSYACTVTESSLCHATTQSVNITVNANETPTIATSDVTTFCEGSYATLSSTPASSYLWSDGSTTQSIQAATSGNYTVTIQGACQAWSSNSIAVTMLASPAPVSGGDVYLPAASTATLNATGNNLNWYDVSTGGTSLGTGTSFTTPVVNTNTTYYVEASASYGGATYAGAPKYHLGTSLYSGATSTNATTTFDVTAACTLKKVKVYTDRAGIRLIELRSATGTVLQTFSANIPVDTSWVQVNFALTPGSYQIGTNTASNNSVLGYASPRLMRTNNSTSSPVNYPYAVGSLISITGSDQGSSVYYYFYDWQVDVPPTICVSVRTPVNVIMGTVGMNSMSNGNLVSATPNPTKDVLNIALGNVSSSMSTVQLTDITGRVVYSTVVEKGNNALSINAANYATGTYILSVRNDKGLFTQKVIFIN